MESPVQLGLLPFAAGYMFVFPHSPSYKVLSFSASQKIPPKNLKGVKTYTALTKRRKNSTKDV